VSDHDDLLRDVAGVRLERFGVQVGSAIEAAAQRQIGYRFQVPGAPPHAGRDSVFHHSLNRLAASDTGRWSLRLGHTH
jgi:hypothetical protein